MPTTWGRNGRTGPACRSCMRSGRSARERCSVRSRTPCWRPSGAACHASVRSRTAKLPAWAWTRAFAAATLPTLFILTWGRGSRRDYIIFTCWPASWAWPGGECTLSTTVTRILQRAVDGERLTFEEGVALFECRSLPALGRAADAVCRRLHPEPYRTYNIDRNINYTNICAAVCDFCAFYRKSN